MWVRHKARGANTISTIQELQAKIDVAPAQYQRKIFGSYSNAPEATPRARTERIPGTRNVEMVSTANMRARFGQGMELICRR